MRNTIGVVLALSVSAGCSKPPTQPSAATPPSPGSNPSAAPVAALQVKVDDGLPRDAVAGLSEVVVDMSASTGTNLTFAIDFGDGYVATTARATHVYAAAGTYTIKGSVTSGGTTGMLPREITVREATGSWFHAGYIQTLKHLQVRQLVIEAQTGTTVRGSYRVEAGLDDYGHSLTRTQTVTGTLSPPRNIRLAVDRGVTLEGTLPGRVNDPSEPFALLVRGDYDSANGERLDFRAIVGTPDGAPPVASMKMRVFGETPWEYEQYKTIGPIIAVTPVQIDATASRGTDLSYWIDFGDGRGIATTSQATRTIDPVDPAMYTRAAMVLVVDRFGRSASWGTSYFPFSMPRGDGGDIWATRNEPDGKMVMGFRNGRGATYDAWFLREGPGSSSYGSDQGSAKFPGSAVLTQDGGITVAVPGMGIEFRGTLTLTARRDNVRLTLVQHGGRDNGRTWQLHIDPCCLPPWGVGESTTSDPSPGTR